jgi:hypothetical protein
MTLNDIKKKLALLSEDELLADALLYLTPDECRDHGLLIKVRSIVKPDKDVSEDFGIPNNFLIFCGDAE